MKDYTKVYYDYFDYGIDSFVPCEKCGNRASDIHHVKGRIGLLKLDINNLMALCRECHTKVHCHNGWSKNYMYEIHQKFLNNDR
jgi:hypothetical protein